MNKYSLIAFVAFLFLFNPIKVFAQDNNADYYEYSLVPYAKFSDNINVNSPISHDILLIGENIKINANIDGDVFFIGQSVEINSDINGDVRGIFGGEMIVRSTINGSLGLIGENLNLLGNSDIKKDVYAAIGQLKHDGRIGGNLNVSLNENVKTFINGKVIQNLYFTNTRPLIEGRGNVEGTVISIPNPYTESNPQEEQKALLFFNLYHAASLTLIYLLLRRYYKNFIVESTESITKNPFRILSRGLITFFIIPFAALLSFITFIGIPLGMIILTLSILVWYISPIFSSLFISKKLFQNNSLGILQFIVSLLIFDLVSIAPLLGIIISVLSIGISFGIISNKVLVNRKKTDE